MPKLTERITAAAGKILTMKKPPWTKGGVAQVSGALEVEKPMSLTTPTGTEVKPPEVPSLGSPAERKTLAEKHHDMNIKMAETLSKSLRPLLQPASKIDPAEANRRAQEIALIAAGSLGAFSAAGILTEVLSLGQFEKVFDALQQASSGFGLPAMMGAVFLDPYIIGIRTPYRQFLNKQFTPNIPPAPDLIKMAVREAFMSKKEFLQLFKGTPELQAEADATFDERRRAPKAFVENYEYQGFSREWANMQWAAHWQLPSFSQAQEMLFRGVIDLDTFKFLLKLNDVDPVWRNSLAKIAYRLPRLRDVRNMWEALDWTDEQFAKALLPFGYRPEDIDKIVAANKIIVTRAEKGRITTLLLRKYEEGFITKSRLAAELSDLGIHSEIIELNVKEAELRRELEEKSDVFKALVSALKKENITEEEFRKDARELGVVEEVINRKITTVRLLKKIEKP